MGMMRYLIETDYLSGSWVRIKKESFTGAVVNFLEALGLGGAALLCPPKFILTFLEQT